MAGWTGIPVAPVLRQITGAMFDDRRIKAAAEFIFPVAGQKVYRDRLVEEFEVNRRAFELNYSLAYRRAADPFEQRGVTVAGLEHIPEVLREGMAAAAERAGINISWWLNLPCPRTALSASPRIKFTPS